MKVKWSKMCGMYTVYTFSSHNHHFIIIYWFPNPRSVIVKIINAKLKLELVINNNVADVELELELIDNNNMLINKLKLELIDNNNIPGVELKLKLLSKQYIVISQSFNPSQV